MEDWHVWLSSDNTRTALRALKEATEELKNMITDGSHIMEKSTGKIALDYTYSLGQLDGMRTVINMIEDIKSTMEEHDGD